MKSFQKQAPHQLSFRGITIDLWFWLKMVLAFIILLIAPLVYYYREVIQPAPASPYYYIYFYTLLFSYNDFSDNPSTPWSFMNLETFIAAIIVCLPAFYFNHRIRNFPPDSPIIDVTLFAAFATIALAEYLPNQYPNYELNWLNLQEIAWELRYFGTAVVFFLILVPAFIIEAQRLCQERENPKPKMRRYTIMGGLWGIATILIPWAIAIQLDEGSIWFSFLSPSALAMLILSLPIQPWLPIDSILYNYSVSEAASIISAFISSGLLLCYAFLAIRYLRGMVSKRPLLLLGLLSVLVPHFIQLQYSILYEPERAVFPIPVVFAISTILILVSRPIERETIRSGYAKEPEDALISSSTADGGKIRISLLDFIRLRLRSIFRRSGSRTEE
ncbi:MAG: hypothetical protein ACFFD6_04010 [Candidatus Thorarchaeota archaeon]